MRLFECIVESKLDTKLEYHDQLNPKLWKTEDKIQPDVKKDLLKIAKMFGEYINVKSDDIKDIILTGSNANYNWSDLSDIDVHLVINTSNMECDILDDYLHTKKELWSEQHNITVKGYNVELYAQPQQDKLTALGIYSLKDDQWVKKPEKKKVNIRDPHIIEKAEQFVKAIDALCNRPNAKESSIVALQDKIWKMRKVGLQKAGEFSIENLVFKTLRNNGYLDKLQQLSDSIVDAELTL